MQRKGNLSLPAPLCCLGASKGSGKIVGGKGPTGGGLLAGWEVGVPDPSLELGVGVGDLNKPGSWTERITLRRDRSH